MDNKYPDYKPVDADLTPLRPNFLFVPDERIRNTLAQTTQYYRANSPLPMRQHIKSRFPAANVPRLDEDYAMDTMFSDTPALDDGIMGHGGATMLQLYTGRTSNFTAGYPMKNENQIRFTVQDFIRDWGAPKRLINDQAKAEIGKSVTEILRHYAIGWWYSEAGQQQQNKAENKMGTVKNMMRASMDRFGIPACCWLLVVLYLIGLLNHLAGADGSQPPQSRVTGQVTDISPYMNFHLYELVYFAADDSFPSRTPERLGWWFGPEPNVGDVLTYRILDCQTKNLVFRSHVRPATRTDAKNKRLPRPVPGQGEEAPESVANLPVATPDILSTEDISDYVQILKNAQDSPGYTPPTLTPEELVGLTFLRKQEDGSVIRAKVEKKIRDRDAENHQKIKFLISLGEGELEELIAYNELSDLIEKQRAEELANPNDVYHALREIVKYEYVKKGHPRYMGSGVNVLVHWENGEHTWEPLRTIAKDDPITCAKFAKEHKLLDKPGWKFLRVFGRKLKKWRTMVRALKKKIQRNAPVYMFGIRVPQNFKEAEQFDKDNGNTLWADAIKKELEGLNEYKVFRDIGHKDNV